MLSRVLLEELHGLLQVLHREGVGTEDVDAAVALDLLTDALALIGQHGVYCQSTRMPGKPTLDIALVVEQCRHQREQELDESLLEAPEVFAEDTEGADDEFDPDEDPLLDRAIEIVVQTQTASVSLIQRRLRVGYTRAGRLIDMLERRGVVSGYEGSKPRRVLVSEADLERVMSTSS